MRRRLLNLLTILSLLLCVSVMLLWLLSRRHVHIVERWWLHEVNGSHTADERVVVGVGGGDLWVTRHTFNFNGTEIIASRFPKSPPHQAVSGWTYMREPYRVLPAYLPPSRWQRLGFDYGAWVQPPNSYVSIQAPLWLPAILFALLPALLLSRLVKRRRVGLCPTCGYDIRATPDKCPECGTENRPNNSN